MTKFNLIATTKVDGDTKGRKEDAFTYRSEDGTKSLQFRAHTKKAFVYVVLGNTNMTPKEASRLVEAFTSAGLKQHEYRGGFDEAITTLTIK